jgi:NAD+ synthase (glutamine-hydrolysing)
MWVNRQPSQALAEAGATVIANLSASDEAIGKDDFRRQLVMMQSARQVCAYIYADAGEGESTTDLVFAGHDLIGENGVILTESERFTTGVITTEIDVERLLYERRRLTTFTVADNASQVQTVWFDLPIQELTLTRAVVPLPFVPLHPATQQKRCEDILTIQAQGLAKRMAHTHSCAVLGLSGGLDSALALMVTVRACDILGLDHAVIHAVTMPCFGTTGRTLNNACQLARACGATLHEIRIGAAVEQHLRDRCDLRKRAGARAHTGADGSCQSLWRHGHRHGRHVRTGARLGDVQRRPYVHVRGQRLGAENAGAPSHRA